MFTESIIKVRVLIESNIYSFYLFCVLETLLEFHLIKVVQRMFHEICSINKFHEGDENFKGIMGCNVRFGARVAFHFYVPVLKSAENTTKPEGRSRMTGRQGKQRRRV